MSDKIDKLIKSAAPVLHKAVSYDKDDNPNDALPKYLDGISLLVEAMRLMSTDDVRKQQIRPQLSSYLTRAEQLKSQCKFEVKFLEQRKIAANSIGHGYDKVFSNCCDKKLTKVNVQDAYIVSHHQIINLVRFCELVITLAPNLRIIALKTGEDAKSNTQAFEELRQSLEKHNVIFHYQFSPSLHDREITFDNGWVVKIGRGLDYFKAPSGKYIIGATDMNMRPCHETTIDIFKVKK